MLYMQMFYATKHGSWTWENAIYLHIIICIIICTILRNSNTLLTETDLSTAFKSGHIHAAKLWSTEMLL